MSWGLGSKDWAWVLGSLALSWAQGFWDQGLSC